MKLLTLLLLSFVCLVWTPTISAAKPRVRTNTARTGRATGTSYSKAKLSRGTNSVVVTFLNFNSVSRVNYTLSYTANRVAQGAVGSLVPSGAATETRDLYFGTCSHGVCTPHRGIQNAVLLVETKLTSGKTHVKRYRIRI